MQQFWIGCLREVASDRTERTNSVLLRLAIWEWSSHDEERNG